MNVELPVMLQAAVLIASIAVVVFTVVALIVLLRLRMQADRIVQMCEELKSELKPLAQETRGVVERLHDLSWRAQREFQEVEEVVQTVRSWSQRANRVVAEIGSVVAPPVSAATRTMSILRRGVQAFLFTLLRGNGHYPNQHQPNKERQFNE